MQFSACRLDTVVAVFAKRKSSTNLLAGEQGVRFCQDSLPLNF
ncbi:MAG: hypothetical protein ACJAS1_005111 [Oleiphilaceae bacterium]